MDPERTRALGEVVRLVRQHGLTVGDIAAALGTSAPMPTAAPAVSRTGGVLVRVLGALGGTFVFAGVCVFIAVQWDAMNSAARVVATLGSGVGVLLLALLAERDDRYARAASPLLVAAAALQATGLLVLFAEYGTGGDWRWAGLVTASTLGLQMGCIFWANRSTVPLALALFFALLTVWTTLDLLDLDGEVEAFGVGVLALAVAVGLGRTAHRVLTPTWYIVGTVTLLSGWFEMVEGTWAELTYLVLAAGLVYLSAAVQSRSLLIAATGGVLAYTAWYTSEYFADSVGWPLALIVFGLLMIGLSALAVRVDRQYVRTGAPGVNG
jgi:hypothetical protein